MPGEPRDVAAKPFNSSTVVVRWAAPADDKQNGVIRAYQIYIQPRNTVSQSPVTSTLIGPKSPEAWLSLVESNICSFIVLLVPAILCHKEPARASKSPYSVLWNAKYPHWGVFCLLLAGSLWHKGAYRTFPCMEANYPMP